MNLYPIHIKPLLHEDSASLQPSGRKALSISKNITSEIKSCLKLSSDEQKHQTKAVYFSSIENIYLYKDESSLRSEHKVAQSMSDNIPGYGAENLQSKRIESFARDSINAEKFKYAGSQPLVCGEYSGGVTESKKVEDNNPFAMLNKMFDEMYKNKWDDCSYKGGFEESGMGQWYNSMPDGRINNSFSDSDYENSTTDSVYSNNVIRSMPQNERSRWSHFINLMSSVFLLRK